MNWDPVIERLQELTTLGTVDYASLRFACHDRPTCYIRLGNYKPRVISAQCVVDLVDLVRVMCDPHLIVLDYIEGLLQQLREERERGTTVQAD